MISRMRSIPETVKLLKSEDPQTAIKECFVRKLCKENKVKNIKLGNKFLVDYDDLLMVIFGENK